MRNTKQLIAQGNNSITLVKVVCTAVKSLSELKLELDEGKVAENKFVQYKNGGWKSVGKITLSSGGAHCLHLFSLFLKNTTVMILSMFLRVHFSELFIGLQIK